MSRAALALLILLVSCSQVPEEVESYIRLHPERGSMARSLREGVLVEGMNVEEVRLLVGEAGQAARVGTAPWRRATLNFKRDVSFRDRDGLHELKGPVAAVFLEDGADVWKLSHVKSIWR